ncbi:MAG TPA: 50S ribosomal protein L13 [Kofleriaceae bacterium]|nr:50S ribosomal protein L13 [Kofleriaceae bacterium]
MMTQKSFWLTKEAGEAQREWFVIDATGQTLGRLASKIAMVLRGKHKATYTPNVDMGDFVIVLNAGAVRLTGTKPEKKLYHHHTLYPGGLKTRVAKDVLSDDPERAIREAVWGMMPKGPLGRRIIKKLKIYTGSEHEHAAQKPRVLGIDNPAAGAAGGKN